MANMNLIHKEKGGKTMEQAITFDYSLLRGRIRELYKSESKFALEMRKSRVRTSTGAFNNKINGRTSFTVLEVYVMCQLLRIPLEEMHKYFFTRKYEFNS